MNDLGYEILRKLNVLENYKNAIDMNADRSQGIVDACNRALMGASNLVRRIQSDPESKSRRLSDLDFLLNELFDDDSELQRRLSLHRGTAAIAPDKPEAREKREDPLPEIENVLIKTGHLPRGSAHLITAAASVEQKRKDGEQQDG